MTQMFNSKSQSTSGTCLPKSDPRIDKREQLLANISDSIATLEDRLRNGKSDTLVHYLECMSRFHSYSFRNQLLIMMQSPEATRVAGFRAWKKLGRSVKKGEKGIAILAPMVRRKTDVDDAGPDATAKPEERTSIIGFRIVYVFDERQTDGKPLPTFASITGDASDYFGRLRQFATRMGIAVGQEYLASGALGVSQGGTIVLRPDLEPLEAVSVLAHEISHELLHKNETRRKQTTITIRETEAEAVAFVVCRHLGIDSSTRSSDYIQLYQGDSETLVESLDAIRHTSATIIEGICPQNDAP